MGTFNDPFKLLDKQVARFKAMQGDMVKAHKEIASRGRDDLIELTGGKVSSKQLRQMGHPFGRGASAGQRGPTKLMRKKIALQPINIQSGRLRGGIYIRKVSGGTQSYDVGSMAKHSAYILHPAGTKRMVGREVTSGWDIGFNGPTGTLRKRHRLRYRAFQQAFMQKQRKP